MSQVDVLCTVSNCVYWKPENACGAPRILITSDRESALHPGQADADWIFSMGIRHLGETPAHASEETACKTFRPY